MSILGHCIHIMEHHLRCVERFLAHAVNPRPVCQRLAEHSFILTFQLTTFRRLFLVLSACAEMVMEHVTEAEVRSAAATVLPVRPLHRAPLFPVQHYDPVRSAAATALPVRPLHRAPLFPVQHYDPVRSAAATVLPVRPLHRAPLFPVQHYDPVRPLLAPPHLLLSLSSVSPVVNAVEDHCLPCMVPHTTPHDVIHISFSAAHRVLISLNTVFHNTKPCCTLLWCVQLARSIRPCPHPCSRYLGKAFTSNGSQSADY
jgi:hypothetical protein